MRKINFLLSWTTEPHLTFIEIIYGLVTHMASTKETGLGIDPNRLVSRGLGILPKRSEYFMDMIHKFKEKYPGLKIIYANCTTGDHIDSAKPNPDFILVVKGKLVSNDPQKRPINVIMVDAPMVFTERSIAGWTIAVEQGNMNGYFEYMLDKALRIDERRFGEYIVHMALLSLDPTSPRYWKRPENTKALSTELGELYARYTTQKPTKLKDTAGYGKRPN